MNMLETVLRTRTLKVALLRYPPLVDFVAEESVTTAFGTHVKLLTEAMRDLGIAVSFLEAHFDQILTLFADTDAHCMIPVFPTRRRNDIGKVVAPTHEIGLGAITRAEYAHIEAIWGVFEDGLRIVGARG